MTDAANAIAVLGVYFALMAVLAVSVEAVISWLKIPIPWLQGRPSPKQALDEVKGWLSQDEAKAHLGRVAALNKALAELGKTQISENTSIDDIAQKVGEATTLYVRQERSRRGLIRLIAILLGIGFAWLFQIDTLQMLAPLTTSVGSFAQTALGDSTAHLLGLVLSGVAASAGSSFWHDQSARLRQLKNVAEAAGDLTGG